MTTLPATYVEAVETRALAYAREWIARAMEGDFIGLGGAPLNPATDYLFARRWCRLCAERSPQGADGVVELATIHGERSAHDALVELIDEKTDRNEPLGSVLGAYSIRLRRQPFRAHSGPERTTLVEDVVFSTLIIELVANFHMKPVRQNTQTRKHNRQSACSTVARAAQEAGLHRGTEDTFRKMWRRTAPRILPGYRLPTAQSLAILTRHCRQK